MTSPIIGSDSKSNLSSGCKHSWEVCVWKYQRPRFSPPTHSVANVVFCKYCLSFVNLGVLYSQMEKKPEEKKI